MTAIKNYWRSALVLLALIVVFAATPAHAQLSVLYNFGAQNAPSSPSGVAQGRDGNLYGTSQLGGTHDSGTVFKITPAGKLFVLYNFCSLANCADGTTPGNLTLRPDGHFVGVTSTNNGSASTIFDISPTGALTTLYNFNQNAEGAAPQPPPVLGADGSFYGVTTAGGKPVGCGTVYRLTGTAFQVLHYFDRANGCVPNALVLGTDGSLYGTTRAGGAAEAGVIYKVTYRPRQSTLFTVLDDLDGVNLSGPNALVQASDGNFYGTTAVGGIVTNGNLGNGAVFKMTPSGTLTVLHDLNGTTDGSEPLAGLVQGTDGNFYGTTIFGGNTDASCTSEGCGTLFQVTPTGSFSVLNTFDLLASGSNPDTALFQHTNGLLYGETSFGGSSLGGVFYNWDGGLPAFVSTVPFMGKIGSFVEILGQGFTSATTVSFNGTPATATVVSGTYLHATVPAGATAGPVTVTTSSGTLTSNHQFVVTQ